MTRRIFWVAVSVVSMVGAPASAAERGGAFAIRGGSARSAVLAETYGVYGGDVEVAQWNPASLVLIPRAHLQASHHDIYGLGIARYSSLHLAWRPGRETASVEGGSIRVAAERAAGSAIAAGIDILGVDLDDETYTEHRPSLTWATPLPGGGSLGAAARYLRASSGIPGVHATGYALDIGVQQPLGPARASVAFYNLLGRVSWPEGHEEDRPREIAAALGMTHARLTVGLAGTLNLTDSFFERYAASGEISLLPDRFALLAGWSARRSGEEFDGAPAFGTWFRVEAIRADYAFQPKAYTPGESHRITLTVAL